MDLSAATRLANALRNAYAETLAALDLAARTADALSAAQTSSKRVVVIALGKSVAPMLAGAVAQWADRIARVVAARPVRAQPVSADVLRALSARGIPLDEFASGHPLPDSTSECAGRAAFAAIEALSPTTDEALVLLSGGASAAACVPRDGVSLEAVRAVTRALLAAGEPVEVINAARGALDALKHGGLSRAARDSSMLTLIAADVLGSEDIIVRAVGSAPTIASEIDPALLERARRVSPERFAAWLHSAERDHDAPLGSRITHVIATPASAREAFATALERAGFTVRTLRDSSDDVAREADWYAACARGLRVGEAAVAVGEPTVSLNAQPGRGGRAGRLALLVAQRIDGLADVAFLAGATDGVDGESGHAGAVVTGNTMTDARARNIDCAAAVEAFDDASAHEALATALTTGPSGINLLDLHVVARLAQSALA